MPGMHHKTFRLAGLLGLPLLCVPAAAQPASVQLSYATYIAGLSAADVQASIALSPQRYRLHLSYRLTGLVGAIVHGEGASTVEGRFDGTAPQPIGLFTTGHFRGRAYVTEIGWQNGRPAIMRQEPPDSDEREPVPEALQANTIDSLSAMAALLRQVASAGGCDGTRRTFDGRRLSELQARTVGVDDLPETSRSSFKGVALRCDFEGRQIAGFLRDADQAGLRRVQRGSAWFAPLKPGALPVPVRVTFDARTFGEATLYLTSPP